MKKVDLKLKKKLIISTNVEEELTLEQVIERYEPYLCKKSIDYTIFAEQTYSKHKFYFSYDDLKQIAYMAIMQAFDRYDVSKGLLFYTFLSNTVNGLIKQHLTRMSRSNLKITPYDVQEFSFDQAIISGSTQSEDLNLKDIISDGRDEYQEILNNDEMKFLTSNLRDNEKDVITKRIIHQMTLQNIADEYKLSRERIRQIEKLGLKKIIKNMELIKKSEENIKKSEECYMSKLKPTPTQVACHLIQNASKEKAFTITAKHYARELGLSVTTIINLLKESGKADEVKALYCDTTSMKNAKKKNKKIALAEKKAAREEASAVVEKEVSLEPEVLTTVPKKETLFSIDADVLEDITEESIEEVKTKEVKNMLIDVKGSVIDTIKLSGAEIDALTIKFNNGVSVSYNKNSMKFNDLNWWTSRDKAVALQEVIGKAIEIFDNLFK